MATPLWPDWLEDTIWAKSADKGRAGQAESLARHTWAVLQRLAEAVHLRPALPQQLGAPHLWNCLFWACFLHDFGKAAQGFQARVRGGPKWPHRHEVLSLAFVDWVSDALSGEELLWVAAAVVSHHKDADEIQDSYPEPDDPGEDPLVDRLAEVGDDAMAGLWRWLSDCSHSWIDALGLEGAGVTVPSLPPQPDAIEHVREHGVARVRHWLRAYSRWLIELDYADNRSLLVGTLALRGHLIASDHLGSAHAAQAPLPLLKRPMDLLARLKMEEGRLYSHQRACLDTRGSAVLIAPTGSGKTEAAILWVCAQAEAERPVPRLFYTLPYQASMNAMYDRLNGGAFPGQVGLEHGRSTLALYRRLLDDEILPQQAARAARRENDLAHQNYFPVRVLSPYQILKGPYRLKGYEALMSDFFGAAFVLDEVHAYEPERLAMILATVKYLREQFGCKFLVMSATLPALLRARLADALGSHAAIRATPELYARFRRHKLQLMPGDLLSSQSLAQIAEQALQGTAVLVCCNRVARAQQACDELGTRLSGRAEVLLLHGRFNAKDRLNKEKAVRQATGARSLQRKPIVLVSTQVVEVSLDIDLDVIYTDPAPLDALIQRFGRVNRRLRKEWAPVRVLAEPSDGQGIYQDDLVQRTLALLRRNTDAIIEEEAISDWLDEVYAGPIAERWAKAYTDTYADFEGACLRTLRAFRSSAGLEEAFYRAFDSIEVLPACLERGYRTLMDRGEPLEASQLLVPLRWGQFHRLVRQQRAREGHERDWPRVVDAPYTSKMGLVL